VTRTPQSFFPILATGISYLKKTITSFTICKEKQTEKSDKRFKPKANLSL